MDAGNTPGAPPRRRFLHWYGAVAAALLLAGSGCFAFGQSGNVAWLAHRDWHLNYDHLGALLFWLGGLLMLPQLASSLLCHYGPGRSPVLRRRVGLAAGAVVALVVLVNSPDNFSISRYREPAYPDDGSDAGLNDASLNTEDRYEFAGFRDLRWQRWADDDAEPNAQHDVRTSWRGSHTSWFGRRDTYEWHTRSVPERWYSDEASDQPQGYECLTRSMRFFGPFQALHLVNVDRQADPARYPTCRPMVRVGDQTLSPEAVTQAYLTHAKDTPLAHAVAEALPEMYSTEQGTSRGEEKLTQWMYAHPPTWDALNSLPKTEVDDALKDIQRQRGRLVCVSGKLAYVTQMPLGDVTVYTGGLGAGATGSHRFFAAGSVGKLAPGEPTTFCGIVIGTFLPPDMGEGSRPALDLVGMFDIPENHR